MYGNTRHNKIFIILKVMANRIRVGDSVNWPEAPNQFRKNKGGKVVKIKKGIAFIKTYWDDRLREVPIKLLTKL